MYLLEVLTSSSRCFKLKENKLWIGATNNGNDMVFEIPKGAYVAPSDREKAAKLGYVGNYTRLGNVCWFTNIDHGSRQQGKHKGRSFDKGRTNWNSLLYG